MNTPLTINRLPAARGDQQRTNGDTTKAENELGFQHSATLAEGLAAQIDWQRTLSAS